MRAIALLLTGAGLAACATTPPVPTTAASQVLARAETVPVATGGNADAADDPAIWRNRADPAASLIVATDKKAGLHVYGIDGKSRSFDPAGRLNNVDLVELADGRVLVAASDRNDLTAARLRLYWLAPDGKLAPYGTVAGGAGEAYGLCLWQSGGAVFAFSVLKDGTVEQVQLDLAPDAPRGAIVRSLRVPTQSEGCVVDPRSQTLFVGEEAAGIWRFGAAADASAAGELVVRVDGTQLVADVEGLAIAPVGAEGGWLIASSQGDNAYALYRLPKLTPAGRFRIAAGSLGATEETDGIAVMPGDFGPGFPGGLFVAQDGVNTPAQNFKLVAWDDILDAVGAR